VLSQRIFGAELGCQRKRSGIIIPICGAFGCSLPHGILQLPLPPTTATEGCDEPRQMTANTGHRSETEQTCLAAAATWNVERDRPRAEVPPHLLWMFFMVSLYIWFAGVRRPNLLLNQNCSMNVGTPTYAAPVRKIPAWARWSLRWMNLPGHQLDP